MTVSDSGGVRRPASDLRLEGGKGAHKGYAGFNHAGVISQEQDPTLMLLSAS